MASFQAARMCDRILGEPSERFPRAPRRREANGTRKEQPRKRETRERERDALKRASAARIARYRERKYSPFCFRLSLSESVALVPRARTDVPFARSTQTVHSKRLIKFEQLTRTRQQCDRQSFELRFYVI